MTPVTIPRRALLGWGAALGAGAVSTGCGIPGSILGGGINEEEGSAGRLRPSRIQLPRPFSVALPVPQVLAPVKSDGDTDYYEITQRKGTLEILPGLHTEIWGYDGTLPGPTIRSVRGRAVVVTHRNELDVPVVVHLHGGKTPPEHDGHPDDWILPVSDTYPGPAYAIQGGHSVARGSREYRYPMDQPAGTLWYHDHRMDFTGPQVYRGLAGFHLVTDDIEQALGLPSGRRDIPLMVMDRSFDAQGQFDYPSVDPSLRTPGVESDFASGVLGDCILVNGAAWPVLDVDTASYRFRILNASNARRYNLTLDPAPATGPAFTQIGSDGSLLPAPVERSSVHIAPGERCDVVIDFTALAPDSVVTLRNALGSGGTRDVMQFRVSRSVVDGVRIPDRLAPFEPLREDAAVVSRRFWFSRGGTNHEGMALWTVNGEPFSSDRIVARPRLGTVERWTIRALNVPHPFHIHLAPFQVVAREGDPGSVPEVIGWKDTVGLDNGGSVELLIRFDGYRGTYVFHCHNLEHEDMRMMATFEVT